MRMCDLACGTMCGEWLSKEQMSSKLHWSERRIKMVEKMCLKDGLFKYDKYEHDLILFGVVTHDKLMSELSRSQFVQDFSCYLQCA